MDLDQDQDHHDMGMDHGPVDVLAMENGDAHGGYFGEGESHVDGPQAE
jgi:hypothetical protein